MRYFTPVLRFAEELPSQSSVEDKFGGLPWGIRFEAWPTCKDCKRSQSLLAQFVHDPVRLDLGRTGRVLSIFQCNHDPGMCSTWEGGSGANACFVTEPEDLMAGLSSIPADSPLVEVEARVYEWLEEDDGIDAALAARYYTSAEFSELTDEELERAPAGSKIGGVAHWVQCPEGAPGEGWRFVGQIDSAYYAGGPNFGDCGIGYVFLRHTAAIPEGWFLWQCG